MGKLCGGSEGVLAGSEVKLRALGSRYANLAWALRGMGEVGGWGGGGWIEWLRCDGRWGWWEAEGLRYSRLRYIGDGTKLVLQWEEEGAPG